MAQLLVEVERIKHLIQIGDNISAAEGALPEGGNVAVEEDEHLVREIHSAASREVIARGVDAVLVDDTGHIPNSIGEQLAGAVDDIGAALHTLGDSREHHLVVLIAVESVVEAPHHTVAGLLVDVVASAGAVYHELRLYVVFAFFYAFLIQLANDFDYHRNTRRTAAVARGHARDTEVYLVYSVKARNNDVLGDLDAVLEQHRADVYRHDIIRAYNSVGQLIALEYLLCRVTCGLSPEVAVADHILGEFDTVFLDDLPEDLHALVREDIVLESAHKMGLFSSVELDYVADYLLEAFFVVKADAYTVVAHSVDHYHGDAVTLGGFDDLVGDSFVLDTLIHNDDNVGYAVVNETEHRRFGADIVIAPIEVCIDTINKQRRIELLELIVELHDKPDIIYIVQP